VENIKMDLEETDWIDLAQNNDKWWGIVKPEINF
jgi:hypothetical protein